jgi:ketosteroid isomerase-like protein
MKNALVLGVLTALVSPVFAQDKAAIEKLNETFSVALDKGDITTIAEMYAEDAFLLPAVLLWCEAAAPSSRFGKRRARVLAT